MASLLIIGPGVTSGATLLSLLGTSGKSLDDYQVVAVGTSASNTYDEAVLTLGLNPPDLKVALTYTVSVLNKGGKLHVHAEGISQESLTKELVLSGFTDCKVASTSGSQITVTASKPSWEIGAKASLKTKRVEASAPVPAPAATWKLSMADDDDELIDDDDLLTEEDKKRPAVVSDDCEVGAKGRKACANCSCGRADAEAAGKVQLTADMLENPESACGSCYLGDAYRCASCPYRGLPSFQKGQKIEVPQDFLKADV